MNREVLDLFCGLGGFSSAFEESDEWNVTTVDFDQKFDPDINSDVFNLRPSDFEVDFEVVLASPPCKQFSMAASSFERIVDGEPQTEDAQDAVALVYHTIGLIKGINPEYWWMENPKGYLRQIIGEPDAQVTYCQYGTRYMKPTDFWGEFPLSWSPKSCSYGKPCHETNTNIESGGSGNFRDFEEKITDSEVRAKVPYELSESIRESVENPLPQNTAEDW